MSEDILAKATAPSKSMAATMTVVTHPVLPEPISVTQQKGPVIVVVDEKLSKLLMYGVFRSHDMRI